MIDVAEPERDAPARGRRRALRRRWPRRSRALAEAAPARTRARGSSTCARSRPRSARPSASSSRTTRAPLHPMRALRASSPQVLDRDAIVIGDGGDFVSYAGRVDRLLRAGLLARPGPVRLPRLRPRLRARRQARAPRPPGRAAARRRRVRLLRDGVRHARPPRRQRRRRDGQQRDLGAREAPDGVPLRLLGRRRPAAGDALRPGRRGARRARRARARARASCAARWSARSRPASRRSSTCSPIRRSPTRGRRTWPDGVAWRRCEQSSRSGGRA